ncbi:helix-turn-helix transcriptional regulator [Fictibacillus gelatini]|uniref:helix-turn-helix transcriptional regulator n=1 Tax=Fictibacillus gelatini TaxID=225985 RepID=UPI00047D4EBE|nr:YafY family protein [Fictibacillus gelatini]
MAKADNMLSILWLLQTRKRMTAKDIAEALEINIRTVYRYIDSLCASGVPIIADSGHNGGYSLLETFSETPLLFDLNEQKALIHAALFAQEAGYPFRDVLKHAILKLKRHANKEQLHTINKHMMGFDVIPPPSNSALETTLQELEKAVANSRTLLMEYDKGDSPKTRHIDPYGLIYWKGKWYIVAYCHLRSEIRSFRADRIRTLSSTGSFFQRPSGFSARRFFLRNLLPDLEKKEQLISVRIEGKEQALNELCEHWLFSHALIERSSNQAHFMLDEGVIYSYVPYFLMPYGKSIKIVEPSLLKKRMVAVMTELLNYYESMQLH